MRITVVCALPMRAWVRELELPAGTTAAQALERSGLRGQTDGHDWADVACAVHGKPISAMTVLRDGDRLELLRPLRIDPKQARRRRARAGD
ncbi:MAG: RnfH family protein [Proteobacteria bacterium]|nr:RnfH family protein [Pseudomonadota bacterium]